jgi:hypothetical protein
MKVHIYNSARSFLVSYWNDDSEWEDALPYSDIDSAVAAAENEIDVRQQAIGAHIIDAETGEIYVTCTWDDDSIPEEDYGDWDYNEDIGFDPYMGCYTDDC